MKKSHQYGFIIIILLVANLMLFYSDDLFGSQVETETYFDFESDQITEIVILNTEDSLKLQKGEISWIVNDQYGADPQFISSLLSVLRRLESGREMASLDREKEGSLSIRLSDGSKRSVDYAVNPNQTKTFFISADRVAEVYVPGYRDNVAGIFSLHPDQWRDRLIFDGSWRTIQQVQVDGERTFEISFADDFFLLNQQAPKDSSAVVDYLNQFQQFQANEMISQGRFPTLDSLARMEPIATLTIDDIKLSDPKVWKIYPNISGQKFHLLVDENGQQMVIEAARVRRILTQPGN